MVPTLQVAEFIWKDHVSEAGKGSQHIGPVKVSIQIHYYWSTWYIMILNHISYHFGQGRQGCFLIMTRVGYRSSLGPLVQHIHPAVPWGECWNGGTHTWRGCITSLPTLLKHIKKKHVDPYRNILKSFRNHPFSHSNSLCTSLLLIPCPAVASIVFRVSCCVLSFLVVSIWFLHSHHKAHKGPFLARSPGGKAWDRSWPKVASRTWDPHPAVLSKAVSTSRGKSRGSRGSSRYRKVLFASLYLDSPNNVWHVLIRFAKCFQRSEMWRSSSESLTDAL